MSYTVVGMFPNVQAAERASEILDESGFGKSDYTLSRYTASGEVGEEAYDYDEDEKTSGFWSWLFGDDEHDRKKYSYAGTKSNLVTVYTDTAERAEEAKRILDDTGAVNVDETVDFKGQPNSPTANSGLDSITRSRIINKAKNDLFLLDSDRNYTFRRRGMTDDMDSLGNKDL